MRKLLFAALLAGGCYVGDGPQPQYAGQAEVDNGDADLVEVSPGVEVIADNDESIFYADNYYWVNRGGIWYSSTWYGGGWGRAGYVPGHISGIVNPGGYRHYRPAGYVSHAAVRGGYGNHAQYHASHGYSGGGGVHVRAAVHSRGGGSHHR